jgi:hypothetical protein
MSIILLCMRLLGVLFGYTRGIMMILDIMIP